MDISGRVCAIPPVERFNGRNGEVSRYVFVIETPGQYSHKVAFGVIGDDRWAERFSDVVVIGNDIRVGFEVTSREWRGRWFTQCDAYRVSLVYGGNVNAQPSVTQNNPVPQSPTSSDSSNDMPF